MHLDYEKSSFEPQTTSIATCHQFIPCVYAASIIDETDLIGAVDPTYISIRLAKHDRLTHEKFEKFLHNHLSRVKSVVVINVDTNGLESNTRYSKTLSSTFDKFKTYNLDALVIVNQVLGQTLFNVVERRLPSISHDLADLILSHDIILVQIYAIQD